MSDVVWAEFNMSLEVYLTGRHISFEQQQDSIPSFVDLAVLKTHEASRSDWTCPSFTDRKRNEIYKETS